MKPELDKKLVKDFPILYQQRYDDMQTTALCWGFPGSGWEPLLRRLSEKLEAWNREHPDQAVIATQVKEKFGTLRFYYFMQGEPTTAIQWFFWKFRSAAYRWKLGRQYNFVRDLRKKFWKNYYEKIEQLVYEAEMESEVTCEECGKPGKLRETGWVLTLCDGCYDEWRKSQDRKPTHTTDALEYMLGKPDTNE